MQISETNFAGFVRTMATVLEEIEERQALKLHQQRGAATRDSVVVQPTAPRMARPRAAGQSRKAA